MKARYRHWLLFAEPYVYTLDVDVEHKHAVEKSVASCKDAECRVEEFVKLAKRHEPYPHIVFGGSPFPADVVASVLKALTQNTNVLLSGAPGTGKTYLAEALCRWLDPLGCTVRSEPQLIPDRFGVDPFRAFNRAACAVLDDLYVLALPRRTLTEHRGLAIITDVSTRLLTFLNERGRVVLATTNVSTHALDWAVTSRFKIVEVPPPPREWWDVLSVYGFRVVNTKASSYREALWGTSKPVVELEPMCSKQKRWEVDRVTAYKLVYSAGYVYYPVAYELYPEVARRIACGRPVIWLNTPAGAEYLGYYKRPIVIMPPVYTAHQLLEYAYEYKATVLSPTAEEPLDVTDVVAEACNVPRVDAERHMECVRRYATY